MPFSSVIASDFNRLVLIYARWVATVASDGFGPAEGDIIPHGAVAIKGGRILDVGTAQKLKEKYPPGPNVKEIDLSQNHILIPGLINCHVHCAMSLLRGYADDMSLSTWLNDFIWPTEKAIMSEEYIYQGTLIAIVDALKSGTTMLNDMYFMPEVAAKAFTDAGIRCIAGGPVLDIGDGKIDEQSASDFIEKTINIANKEPREVNLVRASYQPHAAYTVPEAWIAKGCSYLGEFNKAYPETPTIFHTHLHESVQEREQLEKRTNGKTALQIMDSAGAVNQYMVAAHCVHMTTEEIDLMAKRKANVCHCPKSNLKLASGFCRVWDMMKAGVNVCLGTDGGCSNNSLDMLSEMQMAALLAKAVHKDPVAVDAYTALRMATRNGARAVGRLSELGSIEVGKLADLAAVDLTNGDYRGAPIHDPISHLVYTTHTRVTDVWINGNRIVEDGEVQTVKLNPKEQEPIIKKLEGIRSKLTSKTKKAGAS